MTISIYGSGSQAISTPDAWYLQSVTGPGVFAALVDLQAHDGLEVRVAWFAADASSDGTETMAQSTHITIDTAGTDGSRAVLSPPVPIVKTGRLLFEFIAGTPGSPATVPWVVYKL